MEASKMKNIVVLKNLPSNLVDEAFVVLKPNKKIKLEDYAERVGKEKEVITKYGSKEYMVKEAEMVISNYLSNIENEKEMKSLNLKQVEAKYKRLKAITYILGVTVLLNAVFEIF